MPRLNNRIFFNLCNGGQGVVVVVVVLPSNFSLIAILVFISPIARSAIERFQ